MDSVNWLDAVLMLAGGAVNVYVMVKVLEAKLGALSSRVDDAHTEASRANSRIDNILQAKVH